MCWVWTYALPAVGYMASWKERCVFAIFSEVKDQVSYRYYAEMPYYVELVISTSQSKTVAVMVVPSP